MNARKLVAPVELPRGTPVGRYIVLDRLGVGGAAMVYAAFDPELNRRVAIKLLRPIADGGHSGGSTRLLREAQAMAQLAHPNVVAIHDVGMAGDQVFIAMEHVDGGTLRPWLEERRGWREVVAVFSAAGRGLAAAHAAGMVHRDFKPENVLVGSDGRVRVTDFGLARAQRDAAAVDSAETAPAIEPSTSTTATTSSPSVSGGLLGTDVTRHGAVIGTPPYMAPEQLRGDPLDARTDQFSFCVALYEALYGERPYRGRSFEDLLDAIDKGVPIPPVEAHVPAWLRRVVLRGLAADPAARWPSMDALLAELGRDPTARRRRLLAFAGTALVFIGVGVASYRANDAHNQLCRGGESRLGGVWDAQVKRSIERAFLATGKPYAANVWRSVAATLDRFAGDWTAMHGDACVATRVRGEQTEDVLALRMTCLDGRLGELRALTALLRDADGDMVGRALDAANSLGSVRGCADVAALSAPVRPPADAATRAKVAEVRAGLATAKAQLLAGDPKRGFEQTTPLVAAATALKYRPLEAEALELRGALEAEVGEHKSAKSTTLRALAAATASRHDEIVVRAATQLIALTGYWEARHEEAHQWADFAEAALQRFGASDELEAERLRVYGAVLHEEGNSAEELAVAQRALAVAQRLYGPDDVRTANFYDAVAMALMASDPQAARATYQRALGIIERALGATHPAAMSLLSGLAYLEREQGHLDEALALSRRSLAIIDANAGPRSAPAAIELTNMGRVLRMQRRYDESLALTERALAIYDERFGAEYTDSLYPLIEIGRAYVEMGRAKDAVAPLERALHLEAREQVNPVKLSQTRLALAQALWGSGGDRKRARLLATQARDGVAQVAAAGKERGEAEAWLRAHAAAP